jgi:hypothetical protein
LDSLMVCSSVFSFIISASTRVRCYFCSSDNKILPSCMMAPPHDQHDQHQYESLLAWYK